MLLESFLVKKHKLILFIIFVLALVIRWWFLPQNAVSFAYDQGRDAFIAKEIASGNLKIQGPSSSTPGLYHGVLYFYIVTIPYFLGKGNPVFAAAFLSFVASLGVLTVFWLTKLLSKKFTPSVFAALIFAVSFESVQYSNFLSNASIGMWFVPFIYIGLYCWVSGKNKYGPIIAALGLGLSTQSLITLFYHVVPVAFWIFIFRKKITIKSVFLFSIIFLMSVSTMILTQLRLGARSFDGILFLLTGKDEITHDRTLLTFLTAYVSQITVSLERTIYPLSSRVGAFLGWAMIIIALWKHKLVKNGAPSWRYFLSTYLLSHLFALLFGGINMRHILVGFAPGLSSFAALFIWSYFRNKKIMYVVLLLVLLANIIKVFQVGPEGQSIFPLQPDLVLSKEIAILDYTYTKAEGGPFSISTLTSPLFVNSTWSYLYNWYGVKKYGYLPFYVGKDQVGQLGNNLKTAGKFTRAHFFIMEPTYGIPQEYVRYAFGEQQSFSKVTDQRLFGQMLVQERTVKNSFQSR